MPETMDGGDFRADEAVIIVGGGPVGLSLALGLARYGTRSVVLEKRFEPAPESRAVVIWPRTQEILRDWNVLPAFLQAGVFHTRLEAANAATNEAIVSLDFNAVADIVDAPGALLLPQNITETILRKLVSDNALCELRCGVEVTGIETAADAVATHGTQNGAPLLLRSRFVVGCDGAHGVTRKALGMTLEGMTYNVRVVLSDERVDGDVDPALTARVRADLPNVELAIRFGNGLWRVIATVDPSTSDAEATSQGARDNRMRTLFGSDARSNPDWVSTFQIHRRHAQRFFSGRVVLAGDAAHLNSPAGGQGMNAGIHDAANLAWKLALAAYSHDSAAKLLESYDVERREMVTDTVERITDRATRVMMGFGPRVRRLAVALITRSLRARGMQRKACRSIGMLNGRYTKSPIVDARHPLAGRRIDDLILADGTRINARRNASAALLVVGDFPLDMPHIHLDAAPKRWHVKAPVVVIIRPDGCVAAVVEKPTRESIEHAWNRAFCGALPIAQSPGSPA